MEIFLTVCGSGDVVRDLATISRARTRHHQYSSIIVVPCHAMPCRRIYIYVSVQYKSATHIFAY